jgi:hypothetical protein
MAASDDDEPDMESKAIGPRKLVRGAKRLVAQLSTAFAGRGNPLTLDAFVEQVSEFGWQIQTHALRKWRQKLAKDPDWFDRIKITGRPRLLDEEHEILMTGYVRHQNSIPCQVTYESLIGWIQEEFAIEMTLPTMIAYCDANHLSKLIAKIRSTSKVAASNVEQQRVAMEFIELLEAKKFYKVRESLICCMDITFTGHRKKKVHTIGPTGSYVTLFVFISRVIVFFILDGSRCDFSVPRSKKPQQLPSTINPWTDAIVTCVWADGAFRTPAIAFTYNPQMKKTHVADAANKSKNKKADAKAAAKELADVCTEYQVSADRVVYLEPPAGKKFYCAESSDLYLAFINFYHDLDQRIFSKQTWVIRDAGNAYKVAGESIITKFGIDNDITLPPIVHHAFSVNDNSLHSVAKAWWRKDNDHTNGLVSTVRLLDCLDRVEPDHIKGWFRRNFMMDHYDKSPEELSIAMTALLYAQSELHEEYHNDCQAFYYDRYPDQEPDPDEPKAKKAKGGQANTARDRHSRV